MEVSTALRNLVYDVESLEEDCARLRFDGAALEEYLDYMVNIVTKYRAALETADASDDSDDVKENEKLDALMEAMDELESLADRVEEDECYGSFRFGR